MKTARIKINYKFMLMNKFPRDFFSLSLSLHVNSFSKYFGI